MTEDDLPSEATPSPLEPLESESEEAVAATSGAEAADAELPEASPGLAADQLVENVQGATPPPDPSRTLLDAIDVLGRSIEQRFTGLQTLFEREIRAEATRERIVDRLHTELQEYKQDLLLKVQRPVFIDLIQLHDDIGKMIDSQPTDDADRSASVRGILDSIRTAIEDILYRQGVEPFRCEGDEFDPRRQRAVVTVPTDDAALNRKIAGRLRPGFEALDKVIRPELVSVHTLRK
jgi:molecular chaperone GrpE